MAKDKSEKKRKHISGAPAEVEEDVEMEVSSCYSILEE